MSQISKCPKVSVVLTYWEASGDVSDLRYKSLLYCSSKDHTVALVLPALVLVALVLQAICFKHQCIASGTVTVLLAQCAMV